MAFTRYDTDYETVAASQTDQVLGPTGAAGDVIKYLIIIPATLAAGSVLIQDGTDTAITVFATGTLADLTTIVIPLGIRSRTVGGWSVTTGTNVSVLAVGAFS